MSSKNENCHEYGKREGRPTNSELDLEDRFPPLVRHPPRASAATRSPSQALAAASPCPLPSAPPRRRSVLAHSRDCRQR